MEKSKNKSPQGFLARIYTFDNKLQILHTFGKVMPVVVLGTGAVLFSTMYIAFSSMSVSNDNVSELPQTGSEVAKDVAIIFPENFVTLSLPSDIVLYSEKGFYSDKESVIFYAQKDESDIITIGVAKKDIRSGQYQAEWISATSGTYTLWAEITKEDGTTVTTPSVIVDIM